MFGRRPSNSTPTTAAPAAPAATATAVKDVPPLGNEHVIDAENIDNVEQLWEPVTAPRQRKAVEQVLLERGNITEEQLDQAKKVQSQTPGKTLTQVLLTM